MDFTHRGLGLDAEHAGDERRLHRTGIDEPPQVDGTVEQHVDPAALVTGVHREREETGGDEHEHDTREPEDTRQVELHPAAVDEVAEDDREQRRRVRRRCR